MSKLKTRITVQQLLLPFKDELQSTRDCEVEQFNRANIVLPSVTMKAVIHSMEVYCESKESTSNKNEEIRLLDKILARVNKAGW